MKQCPQCKSVYSDDSLKFCLADGAELVLRDEARTEAMNIADVTSSDAGPDTSENDRVRIDVPADDEQETFSRNRGPEKSSGVRLGIVVAVIGLLLVVIAGLSGFIGYILYQQSSTADSQQSSANKDPRDAEVERLKQKIEELDNRISDEPDESSSATPPDTPEDEEPEYDDEVIKRVNSPNDGFLALRDQPDTERGSRIAKIPHGDIVVIERCQERLVTIGGRSGHWCRARWEEYTGWVFDFWLID